MYQTKIPLAQISTFNTLVFGHGLFLGQYNNHTLCSFFEPIALIPLAGGLALRWWKERRMEGGTIVLNQWHNLRAWSCYTYQQKVGTHNLLCICRFQWPMKTHPISTHMRTLVSTETCHRFSSGTFW